MIMIRDLDCAGGKGDAGRGCGLGGGYDCVGGRTCGRSHRRASDRRAVRHVTSHLLCLQQ